MKKLKILFLDDDKERHKAFSKTMDRRLDQKGWGHEITYVWTANEAISKLKTEVFDEVFLDHDLGGESSQMTLPNSGQGSGYDVACFIATFPIEKRPNSVIIHSWNPEGANRMARALSQAAEEGMHVAKVPFDPRWGVM